MQWMNPSLDNNVAQVPLEPPKPKPRSLVAQMLDLNLKGKSNQEISEELGVATSLIGYHLARNGRASIRKDHARPLQDVVKNCGCRLTFHEKSIALKLCLNHLDTSEKKLRQLIEQVFAITQLELPIVDVDSQLRQEGLPPE